MAARQCNQSVNQSDAARAGSGRSITARRTHSSCQKQEVFIEAIHERLNSCIDLTRKSKNSTTVLFYLRMEKFL
jgi:hypothetical protein